MSDGSFLLKLLPGMYTIHSLSMYITHSWGYTQSTGPLDSLCYLAHVSAGICLFTDRDSPRSCQHVSLPAEQGGKNFIGPFSVLLSWIIVICCRNSAFQGHLLLIRTLCFSLIFSVLSFSPLMTLPFSMVSHWNWRIWGSPGLCPHPWPF